MMTVSLSAHTRYVAACGAGLPLRPHCNPRFTSLTANSLGAFLSAVTSPPSLFCRAGFRNWTGTFGAPPVPSTLLSSTVPTQGRLHCTQLFTACRFIPQPVMVPSHHKPGPPRRQGPRLHAVVDRPAFLTPSNDPRLGFGSRHQELHRCARDGFLGPPSGTQTATRILHHRPL
jgi:hypothetical protein